MSFTSRPINGAYREKLDKFFGLKNCLVEYNPGNFLIPPNFSEIVQQILDLKVRQDDIWMISYPRTGSTWCQEMVWLIANDLDFVGAQKTTQHFRAPVLEFTSLLSTKDYAEFMKVYGNSVNFIENYPSRRFIKTHLPLNFLPLEVEKIKPKIIYIARNPKDVCVSYYHYCHLAHNLNCNFDEFCDLFLNGKVPIGPIWPHYLEFWNKREESNVLFLKYEDMKKDFKGIIRQVARFLEKSLSEVQVEALYDYLSFNNMKNNKSVNSEPVLTSRGETCLKSNSEAFIRKGQVGDWKNYMSPELCEKFDRWIAENSKGTGLYF